MKDSTTSSRNTASLILGLQASMEAYMEQVEDPITGEAPVQEYVSSVPMKWDDPPSKAIVGTSWNSGPSFRQRVSRTPCEILYRVFHKELGAEWWLHEFEVLAQTLHTLGMKFDEGGINKVQALKILLMTPEGRCPFYRDLKAYQWLARALVGQEGQVDDGVIPTPKTLAVANYVAFELRPEGFSYEVKCFMAAASLHHGLWYLPHSLSVAQDELLKIAEERGLGITQDRIDDVRRLIEAEREDPTTIDDQPEKYNEIQALLAMDLEERVSRAISAADAMNEAFSEKVGDSDS